MNPKKQRAHLQENFGDSFDVARIKFHATPEDTFNLARNALLQAKASIDFLLQNLKKEPKSKEINLNIDFFQSYSDLISTDLLSVPLNKQLGIYSEINNQDLVKENLNEEAKAELYGGITTYKEEHLKKIEEFKKDILPNLNAELIDISYIANDPQYFRKALIRFLTSPEIQNKQFTGNKTERANNPQSATIMMEKFLGKEGAKLYQLALEEEMNDPAYRDAVFNAALREYPGEKWKERLMIIISGPSGVGKSYAAPFLIKKIDQFIPKQPNDSSNEKKTEGNKVLFVDGAYGRTSSQIRNLTLQVALNAGYTGLTDLYDLSNKSGMREIKKILKNTLLKTKTISGIFPETFSKYFAGSNSFLINLSKFGRIIFSHVRAPKSQESNLLETVVRTQGDKRSWESNKNDEIQVLDLNKKGLPESKIYDSIGYKPGYIGSEKAQNWLLNNENIVPNVLYFKVINDMMFAKKDPVLGWLSVKSMDNDVILVSQSSFTEWTRLQKTDNAMLNQEEQEQKKLNLPDYAKKYARVNVQTLEEYRLNNVYQRVLAQIQKEAKYQNRPSSSFFALFANNKQLVHELKNKLETLIKNEKHMQNSGKISNPAELQQKSKILEELYYSLDSNLFSKKTLESLNSIAGITEKKRIIEDNSPG